MVTLMSNHFPKYFLKCIWKPTGKKKSMVYGFLFRLIKVWVVKMTLFKTRLLTFWVKVHLIVKCDGFILLFLKGRVEVTAYSGKNRDPWFLEERELWNFSPVVSLVAQKVKHLPAMRETWVQSLGREDPLAKKWQPTPLLLPGESHGWRSLVGYSPWGCKELDMTERLPFTFYGFTQQKT